jgi:AraC family transcriptional regulator, melibiose operon regulatory protein
MDQRTKPLQTIVSPERKFYARNKTFGRFGMRIFKPALMDRPHWHGHVEANYIRYARMHYIVDGENIVIEPNTLIIFWANVPHQVVAVEPLSENAPELTNIYLPLDAFLFMPHIQELQVNILTGGMVIISNDTFEFSKLKRWYADYRSHHTEHIDVVMMEINALLWRASLAPFNYLKKPWRDVVGTSTQASVHVRHVVNMVRHILENIEKPLTIEDVANVTGLHTNYALSLFSKTMLISPKQFIIRMRLVRARSMILESKIAISTIAVSCGFNSISQFYDHFSKAYATTPQSLRKNAGK